MGDLSHLTNEQGLEILALVRATLSRAGYHTHPQWEDLVSFAVLKVARDLARLAPSPGPLPRALVAHSTRWAVNQFFGGAHVDLAFRRVSGTGLDIPRPVPLESLLDAEGWFPPLVTPDFVPALLDSLERQRLWRATFSLLSEEEARMLLLWLSGALQAEVARQVGMSEKRVQRRLQLALNRVRKLYGAPLKWDSSYGRLPERPGGVEAERQRRRERARLRYRAKKKEGALHDST